MFFNLSGNAEFHNVPAIFQPSGAFQNTGVKAKLNLPDSLDLSATQVLSKAWSVSATVRYTRWGIFNNLIINYDNPNQPRACRPSITATYGLWRLGADWHIAPSWTLHGGIAYDESPILDQYREPRLPSADRRWLALGATWMLNPSNSLSFGWAHLFMNSHIPMNHTGPSGSTVVGQWSDNADLFSLQYQYSF